MRSMYLSSTEEKLRKIRFCRTIGTIIYGMIILTLIICLFIKLDYIMKMQVDAINLTNYIQQDIEDLKHQPQIVLDEISTIGEFSITHYCSCEKCCNKSDGITATGTVATEGRTIAVDPEVIPLGSEVLIDGVTYIAEDIGGSIKGNRIDIFVSSHSEAINRGKITREVKY